MKIFNNLIKLDNKTYGLLGLTDESFCVYVNELFNENDKSIIILTSTLLESTNLLNILTTYNNNVLFFPTDDFLMSMAVKSSPELMVTRLETINELLKGEKKIILTHTMSFLRYLPSLDLYKKSIINLKVGQDYNIKELESKLYDLGYKRDMVVYKTGDIAVRGFIIDIYPVGEDNPVRIEFFGDTIDSIRIFDEESQLSIKDLEETNIYPFTDIILEKTKDEPKNIDLLENKTISNIEDYLTNYSLIIKDYNDVKNTYLQINKEINEYLESSNLEKKDYIFNINKINKNCIHYLTRDNILDFKYEEVKFNIKEVPKFNENIDAINTYLKNNYSKTIILCLKTKQIKDFTKYLEVPFIVTDINNIKEKHINIVKYELNGGFIYNDVIFITDKELFNINRTNKKYKTKFKYTTNIKNLSKLEIGDTVVHSIHGIGLYNGIKTLKSNDLYKDYIEILYKGKDKLYLPVENIGMISKYTGKEGMVPKVNSLSGTEWHKTKLRIQNKVKNIASELIKIYAERELKQGIKYPKDDSLQLMFDNNFEFTETSDQLLAITQIKEEMESSHPMDRLLCGDVGFGKTEVAFRAIFKAVNYSKQVLYLCPTTLLSMQIYNNALERFKDFPVNIGLLNRFTTKKEQNRIIEELKSGKIDFVIGTHRILSDDVQPKNLGLLVIDEEQRFGVTHKEKIKKYKANVDVLTLTATPIPRTLQMSMVGIRSLSLITTPPVNRYPIQTYVCEENEELIKQAIYKELGRNGQVFILYNHVETIEHEAYKIKELVPHANILFAHGKMDKTKIEDQMLKFINHEADILICTTIIETGIDIPNVNTLIVLDAENFGLSQLYQIRGRVGRSDKIAYAYMMYKKGKMLNDIALKRLKTIEDFTELGSGFKIASRDLSIRGAGDILGSEQSGFIDSVGIDLYLKILNEEVARLKGEKIEEEKEEKSLINVSTHIDDKYAEEAELKIEIHNLINSIDSKTKLDEIKSEIEDRFGKIDSDIEVYMYQEWFEKLAKTKDIIKVNQTKTYIELIFSSEKTKTLDYEEIFYESYKISRYFKFSYKSECLVIKLELPKLEKHYIYYLIDLLKIIK